MMIRLVRMIMRTNGVRCLILPAPPKSSQGYVEDPSSFLLGSIGVGGGGRLEFCRSAQNIQGKMESVTLAEPRAAREDPGLAS